jgi:hypothetical protein
MKWHDYVTIYQNFKRQNATKEKCYRKWTDSFMAQLGDPKPKSAEWMFQSCAMAEKSWVSQCRPYYNVWPRIARGLTSLNLDVDAGMVKMPLHSFAVRLSADDEFDFDGHPIGAMLVSDAETSVNGGPPIPTIQIFVKRLHSGHIGEGMMILEPGRHLEECVSAREGDPMMPLIKLACSICLIDKDCGVLEPEVLSEDKIKYMAATPELQAQFIERAARRGVRGWSVGRAMSESVDPHFRRPHFATRWKGHGPVKNRVVVPVRGSVVKRVKAEPVPTGYLDAPLCAGCKLLPVKVDAEGGLCDACSASLESMGAA